MTDSNFQKKRLITPERAAIILPTLIASFFAFIIISTFVIPKYVKSNKVNNEYKEFLRKKAELPQLKLQYKIINEKLKKLNDRKTKIINLVSGESDLETFLERLGDIGFKNKIKILSINPKNVTNYVPLESAVNESSNATNKDKNFDPLLSEGIIKYTVDLDFESDFKNLLYFLRELEFQESVILFRDMKLNLKDNLEKKGADYKNKNILKVSMKIIVYGKINSKKNKI